MLTQSELQWLEDRKVKCHFCIFYNYNKYMCTHWYVKNHGKNPINLKTNKCRCFLEVFYRSSFDEEYEFIGRVIENLAWQMSNPHEALKKAYIESEAEEK